MQIIPGLKVCNTLPIIMLTSMLLKKCRNLCYNNGFTIFQDNRLVLDRFIISMGLLDTKIFELIH